MASFVYVLCAVTSLVCGVLLLRAFRKSRRVLLSWSAVCFLLLGISNILLFLDRIVLPAADLVALRSGMTLFGLCALLYGLIFKAP
jgi:hypothetical protein